MEVDDGRNTVTARDVTDIAVREETDMHPQKSGLTVDESAEMTIEDESTEIMIENMDLLDEGDDTARRHDARAVLPVQFNAQNNPFLRRMKRSHRSHRGKAQNHRWKNRSPILGIRGGWLRRAIRLM